MPIEACPKCGAMVDPFDEAPQGEHAMKCGWQPPGVLSHLDRLRQMWDDEGGQLERKYEPSMETEINKVLDALEEEDEETEAM